MKECVTEWKIEAEKYFNKIDQKYSAVKKIESWMIFGDK
jgi:hypothetical protein